MLLILNTAGRNSTTKLTLMPISGRDVNWIPSGKTDLTGILPEFL